MLEALEVEVRDRWTTGDELAAAQVELTHQVWRALLVNEKQERLVVKQFPEALQIHRPWMPAPEPKVRRNERSRIARFFGGR